MCYHDKTDISVLWLWQGCWARIFEPVPQKCVFKAVGGLGGMQSEVIGRTVPGSSPHPAGLPSTLKRAWSFYEKKDPI